VSTRIVALLILSVGTGLILSVFVTPVFCIFRKIFIVPFLQKRILQKAIAQGHVVQAHMVKSEDVYHATGGEGVYMTNQIKYTYRYEYNGKTYTYRGYSPMQEPPEITLYFERNPKRAVTKREVGFLESNWKKYYLVFAVLIAAATFFVGMCL